MKNNELINVLEEQIKKMNEEQDRIMSKNPSESTVPQSEQIIKLVKLIEYFESISRKP